MPSSNRIKKTNRKFLVTRETALATILCLFTSAIIISLWHLARNSEYNRIRAMTIVTAEQMKNRLESWIDARCSIIRHIGSEWYFEYRDHPEKYQKDTKKFIDLYPGFQAINWVNNKFVISRVVPEKGNENALNKNLLFHPEKVVAEAIKEAAKTGKLTRTPAINLLQGGRGFASYFPIYDDQNRLEGFINGVFKIDTLVNRCLHESTLRDKFQFAIYEENNELIYQHPQHAFDISNNFLTEIKLKVIDKKWKLAVAPSASILNPGYYRTNFITLFFGLLLTLTTAVILRFALKSRRDIRKSETRFQAFMSHLPAGVFILNQDNIFTYVNQFMVENFAAQQWLAQPPDKVKNYQFASIFQNGDENFEKTEFYEKETTIESIGGRKRIFHLIKFPIQLDETTTITGGIIWDVTQRLKAELELKQSLKEKELLLKEIHHRVKNNLQVIMSLLYLQSKRISDPGTAEVFRLNRNRIRSMALVHERLYKSNNFAKINFNEYVKAILHELVKSYSLQSKIEYHIRMDTLDLEIDRAITLGLLLNEIVSNSLKHAFRNRERGNIWINFEIDAEKNEIKLSIHDDGVGLPDDIKLDGADSLGFSLIHTLVDQIQGKAKIKRNDGTEFLITFPLFPQNGKKI